MSIESRVAALPWDELERSLWERGYALAPDVPGRGGVRERLGALPGRLRLPQPRRDGPPPLRRRRVQVLRATRCHRSSRRCASTLYRAPGRRREPLGGGPGRDRRGSLRRSTALARALRGRGPDAADAAAAPVRAGGYNCLHQDLYGDVAFPLQALVPLSRARRRLRGRRVPARRAAAARAVGGGGAHARTRATWSSSRRASVRPAAARGLHRVNVRHGVSRVRRGARYALGVIFHDAR